MLAGGASLAFFDQKDLGRQTERALPARSTTFFRIGFGYCVAKSGSNRRSLLPSVEDSIYASPPDRGQIVHPIRVEVLSAQFFDLPTDDLQFLQHLSRQHLTTLVPKWHSHCITVLTEMKRG
jgi:hypothetical protein